MANHIFVLVAVMLMAGVFGGLVNYYMQSQYDPDTTSLPRSLVVGIGASFLVPVILALVNSDLITESSQDSTRFLIFTGFCLIAAIASRFLVTSVSDRILSEARRAREQSDRVMHELYLVQNELRPLIETETEEDLKVEPEPITPEEEPDVTTANVLKTLGNGRYIFRSLGGLCKEVDVDEPTMIKTLEIMVARNLAGRITGKQGVRWHLTDGGRRLLARMS
ncbi:YEATS-associated helix-containing protein [Saccharospirillum sp. HFRX-1]|uniref:YEATS-associated helix-containing protein n=1 Tax=unclassified Saccharospirillum TaxID=2633430 RepID=UPI00372118DB